MSEFQRFSYSKMVYNLSKHSMDSYGTKRQVQSLVKRLRWRFCQYSQQLNLLSVNPQSGQTHSNNSPSARNSRTNNDMDMKFEPLFKLEKRNAMKPKRFVNDIILANYDIIIIFLIYCWFDPIGKPKSGCNSYFIISNDFPSSTSWKKIKKSQHIPHIIALEKSNVFAKNAKILRKSCWYQ